MGCPLCILIFNHEFSSLCVMRSLVEHCGTYVSTYVKMKGRGAQYFFSLFLTLLLRYVFICGISERMQSRLRKYCRHIASTSLLFVAFTQYVVSTFLFSGLSTYPLLACVLLNFKRTKHFLDSLSGRLLIILKINRLTKNSGFIRRVALP